MLFDDDLVEGDETFLLRVRTGVSPGVRNLPEINSLSTIIDDDVATLQVPAVGETSTAEGGFLSFVMRLDQPTEETVTFAYETADGSVPAATAGADYAPVRGTATIPPGELSVTLAVGTIEDALFEHDENVELRLSNLTGAEPDPDGDVAVGRILDDDDPPAVRVSNPSGDEGAALVFAVTLDAPSGRAGSVTYSTRDGTATAGLDYGPVSGGLDFAAGDTVKTVAVESFGDDVIEGSERFFLDLDSSDFGFDKRVGTGIIRDVTLRRVSVSDADVDEGGVLNFVVGFNGPPASRDITVAYSTAAVTAGAGIDYSDAVESAPGVVRILAGTLSAVVRVQTLLDTLDEDLEQLRLVLSDPVGAVLVADEAVGTIIDDDPEPLLSVDDPRGDRERRRHADHLHGEPQRGERPRRGGVLQHGRLVGRRGRRLRRGGVAGGFAAGDPARRPQRGGAGDAGRRRCRGGAREVPAGAVGPGQRRVRRHRRRGHDPRRRRSDRDPLGHSRPGV